MKKLLKQTALVGIILCLINGCIEGTMYPIKGSGRIVSEDRVLSSFVQIEIIGSSNLILTQDTTQTLRIEADDNIIPRVLTEVVGQKLVIETKGSFSSDHAINVYVSIPELKNLKVKGSGDVSGDSIFYGSDLNLEIDGSGDINLRIEYQSLTSKIYGSGDYIMNGIVGLQVVKVAGSGKYNAKGLQSRTCLIEVSASGDAEISVSEKLDVLINGSGDVLYFGNPQLDTRIKGTGKLQKG
jgi:hypothetical protein